MQFSICNQKEMYVKQKPFSIFKDFFHYFNTVGKFFYTPPSKNWAYSTFYSQLQLDPKCVEILVKRHYH